VADAKGESVDSLAGLLGSTASGDAIAARSRATHGREQRHDGQPRGWDQGEAHVI
jgi:hypothetical protein